MALQTQEEQFKSEEHEVGLYLGCISVVKDFSVGNNDYITVDKKIIKFKIVSGSEVSN